MSNARGERARSGRKWFWLAAAALMTAAAVRPASPVWALAGSMAGTHQQPFFPGVRVSISPAGSFRAGGMATFDVRVVNQPMGAARDVTVRFSSHGLAATVATGREFSCTGGQPGGGQLRSKRRPANGDLVCRHIGTMSAASTDIYFRGRVSALPGDYVSLTAVARSAGNPATSRAMAVVGLGSVFFH